MKTKWSVQADKLTQGLTMFACQVPEGKGSHRVKSHTESRVTQSHSVETASLGSPGKTGSPGQDGESRARRGVRCKQQPQLCRDQLSPWHRVFP